MPGRHQVGSMPTPRRFDADITSAYWNRSLTFKRLEGLRFDHEQVLRIGELSSRSGLSASAIRYYESEAVLPRLVETPPDIEAMPRTT